ncbi:hypothetical protein XF14_05120 [Burkholderia gladioli]|nr:hypothetical protein XF14_05120 [Burkholderia gladioli]
MIRQIGLENVERSRQLIEYLCRNSGQQIGICPDREILHLTQALLTRACQFHLFLSTVAGVLVSFCKSSHDKAVDHPACGVMRKMGCLGQSGNRLWAVVTKLIERVELTERQFPAVQPLRQEWKDAMHGQAVHQIQASPQ